MNKFNKILLFFFIVLVVVFSVLAIENITENTSITDNASVEIINESLDATNSINSPELAAGNETSSFFKTLLNLVLEKVSFIKGEIIRINAQLNYENSSPVSNKPVDFYLNETNIGQSNTNEQGMAEMDLNTSLLEPGVYLVGVDYKGDESLDKSHNSAEITINEAEETVESIATTEEVIVETPQEPPETEINSIDQKVKKIENCVDVSYNEEEPVYGNCSFNITKRICNDEPINLTCYDEVQEKDYSCIISSQTVQKTKKECSTKDVLINEALKLNIEGYSCSTSEDDEKNVIVICDSIYDGNGDGICKSGESCIKFVINNKNEFKRYEKNSREDFIEEDKSYFLGKPDLEVLK